MRKLLGVTCFCACEIFSSKKINRLEIVLITSFYYSTNLKRKQGVCLIFFPNFKVFKVFSQFFGCFSRFWVKFLPIFKVLLKIPSDRLFRSTGSENFQTNIKIRRSSDKNWVISHNVILISTRTNKTKC